MYEPYVSERLIEFKKTVLAKYIWKKEKYKGVRKICYHKREGRIEILWTITTAQEKKQEKKGKRKKTAEREKENN